LENYAHLYAKTHGLQFICIRPGNAYGIGQRPHVGQGFIATAIASAMCGEPIRIFGSIGTVRDYLYVTDLAAGVICALEKGRLLETYNLGSGVGYSNMDVIEAIAPLMRTLGCEARVERLPERAFDVKTNVLDSTKLISDTGWKPKVEFAAGLQLTCEWLKTVVQKHS
jgi:UDP-glucose 4-epimerase